MPLDPRILVIIIVITLGYYGVLEVDKGAKSVERGVKAVGHKIVRIVKKGS